MVVSGLHATRLLQLSRISRLLNKFEQLIPVIWIVKTSSSQIDAILFPSRQQKIAWPQSLAGHARSSNRQRRQHRHIWRCPLNGKHPMSFTFNSWLEYFTLFTYCYPCRILICRNILFLKVSCHRILFFEYKTQSRQYRLFQKFKTTTN